MTTSLRQGALPARQSLPSGPSARRAWPFLVVLAGLASAGCDAVYPPDPPAGTIIFPVATVLVPAETPGDPPPYLLLANSDYDARYSQGSLQSYDLDAIAAAAFACTDPPCADENVSAYLLDEVLIGPQAHSIAVSPRHDRVYVAIRSEADLTWVDLSTDGRLGCEGNPDPGLIESCGAGRRSTPVSDACGRTLSVTGDVTGVVAGAVADLTGEADERDWVMLVHRNGRASVFLDEIVGGSPVPTLVHVVTGLPTDATNAVLDPFTQLVWMTTTIPPAGTTPLRTPTRDIPLIGLSIDTTTPACSSGFAAGRVVVRGTDDGLDSRDVAFSSGGRFAHVVSRRSNGVVTLDLEGTPIFAGETLIREVTPLASEVARGDVGTFGGREILAVTSYLGQRVTFVDAATGDILGQPVPGVQRPQDVAVDGARGLAYVADFGDSVLRVIDMRPILTGGEPEVILRIGRITPIRSF